MGNMMKYAVPAALLAVAWKFGKLSAKDIAGIAAVAVAANMLAPALPVVGPMVSK